MNNSHRAGPQVSREYRNLLTEVVLEFLVNAPPDFVEFASSFFSRKISERNEEADKPWDSDSSTDVHPRKERRAAVAGDAFNEEDLLDSDLPVFPKTDQQRKKLENLLGKIIFFQTVEKAELQKLVDAMRIKTVSPNEFVIVQGDAGDFFYAVEEGRFAATSNGVVLHEYDGEGSFGEMALMYDLPRACSVQALTAGTLWAMDRRTFRKVLLSRALAKRRLYKTLMERVPMLQTLSQYERESLADAFQSENYVHGERILKEGDPAERMYFIERGKVVVKVAGQEPGEEEVVNSLGEGEYFGEMALITRRPRAASVYAEGDVVLASVTVDAFERLLGPCMDIMKRNIQHYIEPASGSV